MFSQCLDNISLANEIADELFPHIQGGDFKGDRSFVATMRALITPHLPAGFDKTITVRYIDNDGSFNESMTAEQLSESMHDLTDEGVTDRLLIYNFTNRDPSGKRLELVKEVCSSKLPGYARDDAMSQWFERMKFLSAVFVKNRETHNTYVFVDCLNNRTNHGLQCMTMRLFSWFWSDAGIKPTPEENKLALSLTSSYPDRVQEQPKDGGDPVVEDGYTVLIEKVAERYDFNSAAIEKYLTSLLSRAQEAKEAGVSTRMAEISSQSEDLERRLSELIRERYELETTLFGLRFRREADSEGDQLKEFFKANKCLSLVKSQDYNIDFCVYTNLAWWDEDQAALYVDNTSSTMYGSLGGHTRSDWGVLVRGIFVDKSVRIRTCAAYRMDIRDTITGISGYSEFRDISTRIPNPHIQKYHCTGNYAGEFRRAIQKGDYILAVDTAINSAKSINFSDPSFTKLIEELAKQSKTCRCIEDADGNLYTPHDAIKYLKKVKKGA